jgi:hypothetical protein
MPARWTAVTPWRPEREYWYTGVDESDHGEHAVSAAIGFGNFHTREFTVGDTLFQLAYDTSIGEVQVNEYTTAIETVARYIFSIFGRSLGPRYTVILIPQSPTGDDIVGEGWGTGQGQTMHPLTPSRLTLFAEQLIDAFVRHRPYRTILSEQTDYWFIDGLASYYAPRAVAHTGLISNESIMWNLAYHFVATHNVIGIERNLERLYESSDSHRIERSILAPIAIAHLDRELKSLSHSSVGLDDAVHHLLDTSQSGSIWDRMPFGTAASWEQFRDEYVRVQDLPAVGRFYALGPPTANPVPGAGRETNELVIAYTGKTDAFLENCGCKSNQSGGIARRASVIHNLRTDHPELLVLDAGDAFIRPKTTTVVDSLSQEEESLYLSLMEQVGYDAIGIGTTELTRGADYFMEQIHSLGVPYVSGNVSVGGSPIAVPSLIRNIHDLRIGIIGVLERPASPAAPPGFEDTIEFMSLEDPVEFLCREVPLLRAEVDLVIALGRLTPLTIRKLVAQCSGPDVIISTEFTGPFAKISEGNVMPVEEDSEGFLERTLVLYTKYTSYGLSVARLGLDREGSITTATMSDYMLDESIPDDPTIRQTLTDFYESIAKTVEAHGAVSPLFRGDPIRSVDSYVGGAQCVHCHEAEQRHWLTTKHANAYATLLDRHRHFNPKCVSCHVVAYGLPSGYGLGDRE